MKNLLKKSTDLYIALLNSCTAPLLHGYSLADDEPKTQKLCAYNPELTYSRQTRSRRIQEEAWTLQKSAEVLPWSSTPSKEVPQIAKGQPVWVKTLTTKEAVVIENASPRSVVIQTDRGTQLRNRNQLYQRNEKQTSAQTTIPKVLTLPKQKLETRDEERCEELAEERATTTVHQPAEGPGNLPPDNMPVEQTGWKTVYTKSGWKVQAPQRLDLWKNCTLTCLLMWNFVWLLKFRSSCKMWISKTVLNPSRKMYFACS